MTPVQVPCPHCRGLGYSYPPPIVTCRPCEGLGRVWAPGAPSYGCSIVLEDRIPGEIVTLGNGDHGRILWHSPSGTPMTYLGIISEFDGHESHQPIRYPSCIGVASVSVSRMQGDTSTHANERSLDMDDPIQRSMFYNETRKAVDK